MNVEDELARLATTSRCWARAGIEDTTPGLIQLCREWIKPDCVMAEIGCFAGVSTSVFACFARTVYAVDPWTMGAEAGYAEISPSMVAEAEKRFARVRGKFVNILALKDFSVNAARCFADGALDAVYIDGEHAEKAFKADVTAWRPKVKPGGLFMGHDFDAVGQHFDALGLPAPVAHYIERSWVCVMKG